MKTLKERLSVVEKDIRKNNITVMIIGLGSVGAYLLDYLVSKNDSAIKIVVVGRDRKKMESDVNIIRISALIRELNKCEIVIESDVDLTNIVAIRNAIQKHRPNFIVNSSRAYAGLKYGSISWSNVRAYGIWTPLAIRFTKNIMEACDNVDTDAVVINTSYSDAVIPWLKSAGVAYPDFGSGNLNHLVPRMRFAVAEVLGVPDFWNVDISIAVGHFHDVCISKEGQTEGVELPLRIYYKDTEQTQIDKNEIIRRCNISMPVDKKRNMMNASSNYRIIDAIITAVRRGENQRIFSPGVFGNIGGYPVMIGYKDAGIDAWIDDSLFSMEEMNHVNKASMYLDGIEDIREGTLIYTDELIEKTENAFGVKLQKMVGFSEIEQAARWIIDEIIIPQANKIES